MKKSLIKIGISILFVLLFANCAKIDNIGSTDAELKAQIAQIISHVTSGLIPSSQDINVKFTQPIVGEEQVGRQLKNSLLMFSPPVKGVLKWKDTSTLSFAPDKDLANRKAYTATLKPTFRCSFLKKIHFFYILMALAILPKQFITFSW